MKVLLGKSNRLFLDNDTNEINQQHRGELGLAKVQRSKWFDLLEKRKLFHDESGVGAALLIPPDSQSVYFEDLPYIPAKRRVVHELLAMSRDIWGPNYLTYPLKRIQNAKTDDVVLYPKTDTHWSPYAALKAFEVVCMRLGLPVPNADKIKFNSTKRAGDLGNKLQPPKMSDFATFDVVSPASRQVFNNNINVTGRFQIFLNSDQSLPKCIWFGTSFSYPLLRIAKESFSVFVFAHRAAYDYDIIEKVMPDFIINEIAERFLVRPPAEDIAKSHLEIFSEKYHSLADDRQKETLNLISNCNSEVDVVNYYKNLYLSEMRK